MMLRFSVLLICFFSSVCVLSQSKTVSLKNSIGFKNYFSKFKLDSYNLKGLKLTQNESTLYIYSKTTKIYTNYFNEGEIYISNNSNLQFENNSNFLINLSMDTHSFINNSPIYQKKDSFNPYGATNFRSALVYGVLGLLFN